MEHKVTTNNRPIEGRRVLLTYEAIISSGPYGGTKTKTIVTRRAFWSNSDGYYDRQDNWIETPTGYFHVPQYWKMFTFSNGESALLPDGFYHYGRVFPEEIINWKYEE